MSVTLTTNLPQLAAAATKRSTNEEVTEIVPPQGWQSLDLRQIWRHRNLLYFFAWRDLKVRYKQTVLGAAWAILQPALLTIIFSFVMQRGSAGDETAVPYPIFVLAGLVLWNLFATALGNAANSLIAAENLITKIYFPRLLLPLAAIGPCLVDFAIACAFCGALLAWYQVAPAWTLPLAILPILVVLLLVVGIGSLLAALNITYRDFRYTTSFMLQAWLFGTPTIFMAAWSLTAPSSSAMNADSPMNWFLIANPLNGCIAFFRAAILGWPLPWSFLATSLGIAVALCVAGCFYFRRVEDSLADII